VKEDIEQKRQHLMEFKKNLLTTIQEKEKEFKIQIHLEGRLLISKIVFKDMQEVFV